MKKYPLRENNRFVNFIGEPTHSFFVKSVYMYLLSFVQRFRKRALENSHKVEFFQNFVPAAHRNPDARIQTTWIGHATFLVQIGGFSVITDPVFGNLSFLFKRIQKPGLGVDQLPPIDAVVLSHNHRDHLDEYSVTEIVRRNPECHFYVPFGDKAWFTRRGITRVTECLWWDVETLKKGNETLTIQFLPAYHWSQRGLFDRNKSLWGSWLLRAAGESVYFAGDTAYDTHFKQIAQEVGHIDVALMPIGPCEPHDWMKLSHMNAEEACRAFLDLRARVFIPMHWGTYRFGVDSLYAPLTRCVQWWNDNPHQTASAQLVTPIWGAQVGIAPAQAVSDEAREKQPSL